MNPPSWLTPIVDGARSISATDLSRFVPPEDGDARPGGVLMLFGEGEQGPDLLLTERSHTMRSHPGQISFPGGSLEAGETEVEAALREANEEVGLDPAGVSVLAQLPPLWLPPSNFAVTVVIGWWAQRSPVGVVDEDEVERVLCEPLDGLLDPANRVTVSFPEKAYNSPGFWVGPHRELLLWGFTAGVVSRLFEYVGWTRPWDDSRQARVPPYMFGGTEVRKDQRP